MGYIAFLLSPFQTETCAMTCELHTFVLFRSMAQDVICFLTCFIEVEIAIRVGLSICMKKKSLSVCVS